ncbi:hypothetical protein [Brevundimonas sp. Root1279]|uniref:hypothetical protein n=1 Tax=Brevundimonas sp. Root1279 TaxID=1736443 RepID=UPI0006F77175|nr:hypothetical protein [Brevundimonas sp. Root1279]KQW79748.1 hypothetical protein ASC65_14465 [Brevundimonas sp. Root1279]
MEHVSAPLARALEGVASRLSCINELRECTAMSAVDTAIEEIREWVDRWGPHMKVNDPEEYAKTQRILGTLIELQANEVQISVREGEVKHIREVEAARVEQDLAA